MDAIKSGLTVAAGTGAGAALLLAARRQWLQERDQSHREETDSANQVHQQHLAEITELDATERRITDLYTKAVDQIGSDKAPVRLGGLYALERLAQDNPSQRQTIVNVICAYLRMPYIHSKTAIANHFEPRFDSLREELQVRLAAQRIIAQHLKADGESKQESHEDSTTSHGYKSVTFWDGVSIDLTGAALVDLDFSDCTISKMECAGAVFTEGANFSGATFVLNANFSNAEFSANDTGVDPAADFSGATFHGVAEFNSARFTDMARFVHVTFEDDANFMAHFLKHAGFDGSTFKKRAFFLAAKFDGSAFFSDAKFERSAIFEDARFTQGATGRGTYFNGAVFSSEPDLYGVTIINALKKPRLGRHSWPEGWVQEIDGDGIGHLVRKNENDEGQRKGPETPPQPT